MVNLNLPKTYDFGFGEVVELKHLETTFGITHSVALCYLKVLRIKPLYFNDDIFFCLSTFNRILFVLSRPGGPGFIFPGSKAKGYGHLRKKGYLSKVTDEILEQAEVEKESETFLRQALAIEIPTEDGAWLKSIYRLAAIFLELAYGDKKEANRALPWLLFSLGMAYERYHIQKKGYNGEGV